MFGVLWRSVKDVFDEMFLLIMANIAWCVISLPLLALAGYAAFQGAALPATIFALLGVLPLGPANMGLYSIAQRVTEGRTSTLGQFFAGMKEHAVLSWKVYGLWMVGLVTILFNMGFYAGMGSTLGAFLQILFIYLLIIWLALLMYIGPLAILQTDKRLKIIARNAALMTLGRPIFTIVTVVLIGIVIVLSLLPGVFIIPGLILFAFLAVWNFRATTKLIEDAEERRRQEAEKAAGNAARLSTEKGRGGQIRPRD